MQHKELVRDEYELYEENDHFEKSDGEDDGLSEDAEILRFEKDGKRMYGYKNALTEEVVGLFTDDEENDEDLSESSDSSSDVDSDGNPLP